MIRVSESNVGRVSAALYTAASVAAGILFLLVTSTTGDYSWVSRIGGAVWVSLLVLIILMPTVTPLVRARAASMEERSVEMAKDPVCGMDVEPASAAGSSEYKGKTYYFCAPGCKKSFDEDPEKYLTA